MRFEKPPDGGWSLREAFGRFTPAEKLSAIAEAPTRVQSVSYHSPSYVAGSRVTIRYRNPKRALTAAAVAEFLTKFMPNGATAPILGAIGRRGDPLGPWEQVPGDAFAYCRIESWPKSILLLAGKIRFYSVNVYEVSLLPADEGKENSIHSNKIEERRQKIRMAARELVGKDIRADNRTEKDYCHKIREKVGVDAETKGYSDDTIMRTVRSGKQLD